MAELIDMPKLSDTMETGTLVNWLIKEGDPVSNGTMVAEVETDKATMEVECFSEGTLLKQYIKPGDSVLVGAPICAIGEKGETAPEVQTPEADAKADSNSPVSEKEADKASDTKDEPVNESPKEAAPKPPPSDTSDQRIKASPVAKRMAEDKGISLGNVTGSGPGGRIVKADIEQYAPSNQASSGSAPVATFSTEDKKIPVSNMRSAIARRLLESKTQIPHFYLEIEVNAEPLAKMRKNLNSQLMDLEPEKGGIKFTVNDLILKATTEALIRVPGVNTSWNNDHIIQHGSVHLAFGVAIEDGLLTPVVNSAEAKTLRQISIDAKTLIQKARAKKLKPEEMSGSTFTVTNLGMFGIKNFYGIINPPNAGILSVGAPLKKPIINDAGDIVPGSTMSLGFSGDHRVVDGATGALFLNALKDILETPEVMLV